MSAMHRQNLKVSSLATAYCSGRMIPTVGLIHHWGNIPTIKATPLHPDHNRLLWQIEEVPLKQVNNQEFISFLQQNIISCFGVPVSLVFDNATYFSSFKLYDFALQNGIVLKHSSNYYLQGNGLTESTNKNLIGIIKKTVYS